MEIVVDDLTGPRGETADWQAPADEIGEDWAAAFGDRAEPVRAAWRAADLDRLAGWFGRDPGWTPPEVH